MTETEHRLITALAAEARGPRRNGLFAVWLFTRTAEDVLPPALVSQRGHRRRVEDLQRRLGTISLPPPLRRALAGGLRVVAEGTPRASALALHQLVAPARDTLGNHAADVLAEAASRARRLAVGEPE